MHFGLEAVQYGLDHQKGPVEQVLDDSNDLQLASVPELRGKAPLPQDVKPTLTPYASRTPGRSTTVLGQLSGRHSP